MGSSPSAQIKMPLNFNYFALQFYQSDRLRLIAPTGQVKTKTQFVLDKYWGLQNIHDSPGFTEYHLKGHPWEPSVTNDSESKLFLCTLIKHYYSIGWHLKGSTDFKYYDGVPDVMIFERLDPLQTHVICISFNDLDKIRVTAPDSIFPHIRKSIGTFWPYGLIGERALLKSYEFQLNGEPWNENHNEYSVALVNGILSTLYRLGFIYASTVDYGSRYYNVNALYFKYDPAEEKRPENVYSQFFAISLCNTDRLKLINPPTDMPQKISTAMSQIWPSGALLINHGTGSFEFILSNMNHKLDNKVDGAETIQARNFLASLMNLLSQYNWNFYASCVLSESINDKSTLFFRFSQVKPLRTSYISLNETDKLRLMGGDGKYIGVIRESVNRSWLNGIRIEAQYFGTWQIELEGHPFMNETSSNGYACFMMLNILADLEEIGYRFMGSVDISGKHTWFFADGTSIPVMTLQHQPTVQYVQPITDQQIFYQQQ
jgi:hypothetical protein